MMTLRQRSVNVSRFELLEKLKQNLEFHRVEYKQALVEFHERLLGDLVLAVDLVNDTQDIENLRKFDIKIQFPQNHEQDYLDVIEMLELSVDDNINIDAESFKAYVKNEWQWQHTFKAAMATYKLAGSFLSQ